MINTLQNLILGNYDKIKVRTEIEEKIEDIDLAIKYTDHGDEFLVIRSNGKYYEYGWWQHRPGHPDYKDLDKPYYANCYIRKPKLYFKEDHKYTLSNSLYWKMDTYIRDRMTDRIMKKISTSSAQIDFEIYLECMEEAMNSGITYHKEKDKETLIKYLEINEIKTRDNLDRLDKIKFTSRIDGADGIAGKREIGDQIHGDKIDFIFYKGKPVHWRKTKRRYTHDEWGFSMFSMSLKQFK